MGEGEESVWLVGEKVVMDEDTRRFIKLRAVVIHALKEVFFLLDKDDVQPHQYKIAELQETAIDGLENLRYLLDEKRAKRKRAMIELSRLQGLFIESGTLEGYKNLDEQSRLGLNELIAQQPELLDQFCNALDEWSELDYELETLDDLGMLITKLNSYRYEYIFGTDGVFYDQIKHVNYLASSVGRSIAGDPTIKPSLIGSVISIVKLCHQQLKTFQQKALLKADWQNFSLIVRKAIKALGIAKSLSTEKTERQKITGHVSELETTASSVEEQIPSGAKARIIITESLERLTIVLELLPNLAMMKANVSGGE